jgi:hypothetical protein
MFCAECSEPTDTTPCSRCGREPRLAGRYALVELLGKGAAGTTWRGLGPDGPVAIKETTLGRGEAAKASELAEREAQVLRQLRHPQIPRFVERLQTDGARTRHLWLVQELVAGVDLRAGLADHRWSEDEVLALLVDLCAPLGYLHSRSPPLVHRDLKPANVVRGPDGRHRLVDFGSVRDGARGPYGGSTVAGTFGYMAPEQFAGDAEPRSDLYGLGALAVALLVREDPAKLQGPDRRVRWRDRTTVSPGTAALLDDLLALEPAARPATAEVVAARATALLEAPATSRADPPLRRAPAVEAAPRTQPAGPRPVLDRPPRPDPEGFHQPPVAREDALPYRTAGHRTRSTLAGVLGVAFLALVAVVLAGAMVVVGSAAFWVSRSPTVVVHGTVWPTLEPGEVARLGEVSCSLRGTSVSGCDGRFAAIAAQMFYDNPTADSVVWVGSDIRASDVERATSGIRVREGDVTAVVRDPTLQPRPLEVAADPFPKVSAPVLSTHCLVDAVVGTDGLVYTAEISGCPAPYHRALRAELERMTFPEPPEPTFAHLDRRYSWDVGGLR